MSTHDMKRIIQSVKAETDKDIVCDYFDSSGLMVGKCGKDDFSITVPTTTKKFRPDPKNQPDVYETVRIFDVEAGIAELIKAVKPKARAPKAKATPAKAAPSDADTAATA